MILQFNLSSSDWSTSIFYNCIIFLHKRTLIKIRNGVLGFWGFGVFEFDCLRFRFNYVRYSSGWQMPVKNELDTVAEGGRE